MIDKTIEDISTFMIKEDPLDFPVYNLPEGYSFTFYEAGMERDWARLEMEIGQFDDEARALRCFENEFIKGQRLRAEENLLFVKNKDGKTVATGALWDGDFLGERLRRIHWIAVSDECRGKGIAKALITRIMELNSALCSKQHIYLWTGTRYYPAVSIYLKFGFEFYEGGLDPQGLLSEKDFREKNQKGIGIIREKFASRSK